MLKRDLMKTSTESLVRNKARSLLTILGIVIGIAAVILMLSIGQGAEGIILSEVADLGSDLVFLEPSVGDPTSGPPNPFIEQTITFEDAEALERTGYFEEVSPILMTTYTVSAGEETMFASVEGADDGYLSVFPADLKYGRYFSESDVGSYDKVAVLGVEIAEDLFGEQDPTGMKIKINKNSFRVIGVFEPQGTRFFQNLDTRITVPVTTMQRDLMGVDYVSYISMIAAEGVDIDLAKDEVRYTLRDTHNIDNPEGDPAKDDFYVSSQDDAVEIIGVVGGVLTILLSSIAAISLVVGGIGIMNIMLVSVTERTREIGLRKALGALYREILWQFLAEAVVITMVGGILGVLIGVLISIGTALIVSQFVDGWNMIIPINAIFWGIIVATTVGLIFGIYPARRAAKLNPIDALRYE
jgi:putative ABC transport system permease protein